MNVHVALVVVDWPSLTVAYHSYSVLGERPGQDCVTLPAGPVLDPISWNPAELPFMS